MTISDSDYSSVIETIRGHIAKGTQPNGDEMKLAIGVVKDAADRLALGPEAIAVVAAVAAFRTTWDTHIAILQAGAAGDISAEVDTADTETDTDLGTLETAVAALVAIGSGADIDSAVTDLRTVLDAQFVILQAGGAGDLHAEVDTADAAIEAALVVAEGTDVTPVYVDSAVADG
jgi:hypothetical protein